MYGDVMSQFGPDLAESWNLALTRCRTKNTSCELQPPETQSATIGWFVSIAFGRLQPPTHCPQSASPLPPAVPPGREKKQQGWKKQTKKNVNLAERGGEPVDVSSGAAANLRAIDFLSVRLRDCCLKGWNRERRPPSRFPHRTGRWASCEGGRGVAGAGPRDTWTQTQRRPAC